MDELRITIDMHTNFSLPCLFKVRGYAANPSPRQGEGRERVIIQRGSPEPQAIVEIARPMPSRKTDESRASADPLGGAKDCSAASHDRGEALRQLHELVARNG